MAYKFRLGPQETRFTRNVYLHRDLQGLNEYQTVDGSAMGLSALTHSPQCGPLPLQWRITQAVMERSRQWNKR